MHVDTRGEYFKMRLSKKVCDLFFYHKQVTEIWQTRERIPVGSLSDSAFSCCKDSIDPEKEFEPGLQDFMRTWLTFSLKELKYFLTHLQV